MVSHKKKSRVTETFVQESDLQLHTLSPLSATNVSLFFAVFMVITVKKIHILSTQP